mmetsp:Transcript_25389/g.61149  ORF Transcript_25389/g.61149 Transcript_25389/m.61149 type:complete len:335 (-) Transcript_25389:274-1278(-)|eukprot:CAMPEP_0114538064 /NCGR_PEP_ID=MMETSP0109-20121206/29931_1 /TAXON_ID=29199 /ORGANISM="Chlorarachnion reptans, Strain CCCM449" /LENGTH=334 /DNA_ID=CAMNT_0001722033 /DNA_START=517 /DNA_END=1521 /DNA_ORIENTATION=+
MHQLPCSLVSIDAKDTLGDHQTNVHHHVHKHRLDVRGAPIGESEKVEMKRTLKTEELHALAKKSTDDDSKKENTIESDSNTPKDISKCLSCYGAEAFPGQCCNTCDELRSAYTARGWALNSLQKTEQCEGQPLTPRFQQLEDHEGCRITGFLNVTKVAGNFHLSPGKTHEVNELHVYDLGAFKDGKFNISHRINSLSFGEHYPGIENPLDGESKIFDEDVKIGMFQYYIKVVPTRYQKIDGTIIETNQFSVTEHLRKLPSLQNLKPGSLPGIFVHYDFSPMRVEIIESHEPGFHFLTQLCAILGGVFTVAGMIDQMLYQSMKRIRKKISIGKFS